MSTHVLKVEEPDHQKRLDVYLTEHLKDIPSRSFVKHLIDDGCVSINESCVKPNHKVRTGESILVEIPSNFLQKDYIAPENIPLDIFYEDEQLFIINKPIGMLVHPARGRASGTLVNALLYHSKNLSDVNSDIRPGIVHRLDEDTSGLIIIAKDNISHTKLAKQFQRHRVKKQYVALVEGDLVFDEDIIRAPLARDSRHRDKKTVEFSDQAKESETKYRVIKRQNGVSLVNLYPKTGRTHQLRVHMKYIKHPILGDSKYGNKGKFHRLALHAQSIGFIHPLTKKYVEFYTPIPEDFVKKVTSNT